MAPETILSMDMTNKSILGNVLGEDALVDCLQSFTACKEE